MPGIKYAREANSDPKNPYRPGTMFAALYEEDFSDLTVKEIAEVFGTSTGPVRSVIYVIKRDTGKQVQVKSERTKNEQEER